MAKVLWRSRHVELVRPELALTAGHLAIRLRLDAPIGPDVERADDLVSTYRRVGSALAAVLGCDGFGVSFALGWTPYGDAIGEPLPEGPTDLLRVFGRWPGEPTKPVRLLACPVAEREVFVDDSLDDRLCVGLATTEVRPVQVDKLLDVPVAECTGCGEKVEREQELWVADGVRVIRPTAPLNDANLLMLPIRHVVSLADLTGAEVVSMHARLREVATFFGADDQVGLSCFANDGKRAGQETPHVHVHVFGRSEAEAENPFEVIARLIGAR